MNIKKEARSHKSSGIIKYDFHFSVFSTRMKMDFLSSSNECG